MRKTVIYEGELGELFEYEETAPEPISNFRKLMRDTLKKGTIKLEFECPPEPLRCFSVGVKYAK